MKVLKILLVILVLGSIGVLSLGCPEADTETALEQQVATVQLGDLTVDIMASGNLALSRVEDLAFDIPGRAGEITVEEILVEVGDSVEEGQLLARLDTSEWDDMLVNLERDLLQAEIDLKNAELSLDKAEAETVTLITGDIVFANNFDDDEIDILELRVELAEAKLEDAQKALAEALEKSPEIIAPFDGFITRVNVEGGDEVLPGTVAVQLADPNKFEADILVSEMDILQVNLGMEAWVDVDAMQGMSLPAKVTRIAPTATIQQGVVNYQVKVEVESLEAVMREGQEAMEQAMADIAAGEIPGPMLQAIEEGLLTREEAEEILEAIQSGEMPGPPPGMEMPEGMEGMPELEASPEGQLPSGIPENFQLREGLTVTVTVIVEARSNVLLVPSAAITTQQGQSYAQVVTASGETEERAIETGISDYQFTEVTGGLSEGEQVLVPQGTAVTSPTTSQGPPRMGLFGPRPPD